MLTSLFQKEIASSPCLFRRPNLVHPSTTNYVNHFASNHRFTSTQTAAPPNFSARQKPCWRPTISDVERISRGLAAKRRGTGSRGVRHRLDHAGWRQFGIGRRKGFLEILGSGWLCIADTPLLNSYRNVCDARGQVCIVMCKGSTGLDDEVVVDFSPLRLEGEFQRLQKETIGFVDLPTSIRPDICNETKSGVSDGVSPWETRPIHQLPHCCVSWILPRADAKALGKKLSRAFNTAEPDAESREPFR